MDKTVLLGHCLVADEKTSEIFQTYLEFGDDFELQKLTRSGYEPLKCDTLIYVL